MKPILLLAFLAFLPVHLQGQLIRVGETARGELASGDFETDGYFHDVWRFAVQAGKTYEVTLRADALAAKLTVGVLDDFGACTASDDNCPSDFPLGSDTRITLKYAATASVTVSVFVRSFVRGAKGAYTLTVTEVGANAPTPGRPAPPTAPANLVDIRICVVQERQLREIMAQYDRATGDTITNGRRFRDVYGGSAGYAGGTAWFINQDPITLNGRRYRKYGLPRILGVTEITPRGAHEGVGIFGEAGVLSNTPDVVYVPVRPGCEFQPYQIMP
jgi:hypothetical protein